MAIITIARELGAWTTAASQLLQQKFDGQLFDRDTITQSLLAEGTDPTIIERYDERKPGLLSALSSDQDIYLLQLRTILLKAAAERPLVVLGRCAHVLLEDVPNCLRIRLIAPEKTRVERVMHDLSCDEETARRMMRKCDDDRDGFCRFHFNSEWSNPACYDLVINTGKLSDRELAAQLLWLANHYFNPSKEAAATAVIARKLLAQRVLKHIIVDCKLDLPFVDADVDDNGCVTLHGAAALHDIVKKAVNAAREVEGVREIKNNIRVAMELAHTRI